MCGNSWAHGNSNWAPCLSTKNRQNPDKFIRLPILALLYSLQNCTGLFFANKKTKNSNSRRTPSSTCQYHENAESSIKILYQCKKYFFYFLLNFVISSVHGSSNKKIWLSKTFHPKHHPTSNIPLSFTPCNLFWIHQCFFFIGFPGQKRAAKRALASNHQSFLRTTFESTRLHA